MVDAGKMLKTVLGVVFALAILPIAVDSVADFAVAYPEWATLIGLVTLGLVFGVVFQAVRASGVKMN